MTTLDETSPEVPVVLNDEDPGEGSTEVATGLGGLNKRVLSWGLVGLGSVFTVGGVLWQHQFDHSGVKDLPIIIAMIGIGLVVYGVTGLLSRGAATDVLTFTPAKAKSFALDNAIILAMLGFVVALCIIKPNFMQVNVIADILMQSSPKMFIALGVSFSLIIAGTDLSAGRLVGVSAVVVATLIQKVDYPNKFWPDLGEWFIVWPILIAIGVCALFGLLNGFLVAQFKMHPFIATLAVQVIAYGAVSLYFAKPPTNGQPIGELRSDFTALGQTKLLEGENWAWLDNWLGTNFRGLSILVVYALVACVAIAFVLNKTTFGKNVYAVGGNPEAAKVSGVNSYVTILIIFVLGAVMYAFGGIMEAARTGGATNNYGNGYELDAIAACVVGGVSLAGGIGKVKGIIIGVLTFQIIAYGLVFISVNAYYQQIIKGIIIAVAVALDLAKYNRR
ncbi:MAG: beta-methylgalactoside transporter [Propionibacteriaceae bacterium]|jgi:methyl-galactoside transport system permease protein|nr:beta-methylgalactoside transporter [Propionibacteriaceae bacterium]